MDTECSSRANGGKKNTFYDAFDAVSKEMLGLPSACSGSNRQWVCALQTPGATRHAIQNVHP